MKILGVVLLIVGFFSWIGAIWFHNLRFELFLTGFMVLFVGAGFTIYASSRQPSTRSPVR